MASEGPVYRAAVSQVVGVELMFGWLLDHAYNNHTQHRDLSTIERMHSPQYWLKKWPMPQFLNLI